MLKCRWFLAPIVCCWLAQPAAACPFVPDFSEGPVVFDFEDGLQGWTSDSATRVQTQVLGGDWAIFGDGQFIEWVDIVEAVFIASFGMSLGMEIDLTDVESISFEQYFAGDESGGTDFAFAVILEGLEIVEAVFVGHFVILDAYSPDPMANPGLRSFDLTDRTGVQQLYIFWICREGCPPDDPAAALGFIDNITLYPIPEPGTAFLLAVGLIGLSAAGRRRALWPPVPWREMP